MHKKHRIIFIQAMLLLLAALVGIKQLHQSVSASPASPVVFSERSQLNSSYQYWVVRAYYQDRQMVNELARWLEPWEVHHDQGYLVVGVNKQQFDILLASGFRLEIDQELTELINQPHLALPGQTSGIPGYPCYRTVEETLATIDSLVTSYPELAQKLDIGDSWDKTAIGTPDGYDLVVLKLTNSGITADKPKLFVMASIHAREYAPAELVTRFAEQLLANYNLNADITWLLDYHEIHLLLHANPDGRKYAEIGLYWRKNTNQNYCSPTSNYRGADLNRNFSFMWNCCGGSSSNPCDLTYHGPEAASEPEVQAIQNYVRMIFPDQRGPTLIDPAPNDASGVFLDIHSYGQLVLWPWGFADIQAPNNTALQTLGRKFAYFNQYYPDQAIGLYPTDGATDDFAYGELGLAAYTFEIGTAFFQTCDSFLSTILPNNLPALLYAAKAARTPYMTPAGPEVTNLPVQLQSEAGVGVQLNAVINDTLYDNTNGTEPTQNIAAAEYYIDIPPWVSSPTPVAFPMAAVDGSFNKSFEAVTATINTSLLSPGKHVVYLRGQDIAGNWGAVSAVYLIITQPAYDVLLSPTNSLQGADPGEIITHTIQINNTGTQDDTYTITLSSTWPTSILIPTGELPSGGSLTISAGQSVLLKVLIYAPIQSVPGDRDIAQLIITSQSQPFLSRTAELISVIWWRYFFPMVD